MTLAVIIAGAMSVCAFLFNTIPSNLSDNGICLPSPNLWNIIPVWSWGINTAILGLLAAGTYFLNHHYNFIRSTEPVLPAMFLILTASNPWITERLTSSTLICMVNLISLAILFSCYRERNSTQQIFIIATLFSIGSMFQYAFIPYLAAYVAGALVMKTFRFRELIAMGMGLVAPYWIGIGLGLIDISWFRLPELTNLLDVFDERADLFMMILSVGLAIFFGMLLALNNAMKLYAGNSRVNALNLTVNFVGIVSAVCVIIDFTNMLAYLTTLYFTVATQIANLCALWKFRHEWIVAAVPTVIYVGFFIFFIIA